MKKNTLSALLGLFIVPVLGIGQVTVKDTARHESRSSFSFVAGANVTYPIRMLAEYNSYVSAMPWFTASYNYVVHQCSHVSAGVQVGLGDYGFGNTFNNGGMGIERYVENYLEANVGVFINVKFKKVEWYNNFEFLLSDETTFKMDDYKSVDFYYQTGVTFRVSKHIALTPLISIPVTQLGVSYYGNGWRPEVSSLLNPAPISFSTIRTGLMLTYHFTK